MKKKIYGILLVVSVLSIVFLTLQDAEGTVRLSEGLRYWIKQFGIEMTFHSIRSNAHLVLYFLFGSILTLYGREHGWSFLVILAVGVGIGLIDEVMKVLLPTREFDAIDLVKDWIGVTVAMIAIQLVAKQSNRISNPQ